MKKFINIATDVNKAIMYILENYDGEPISYNELINTYLRDYIEEYYPEALKIDNN